MLLPGSHLVSHHFPANRQRLKNRLFEWLLSNAEVQVDLIGFEIRLLAQSMSLLAILRRA
jgi:hypothetical protein